MQLISHQDVLDANLFEYDGDMGETYFKEYESGSGDFHYNINYSKNINISYCKNLQKDDGVILELGSGTGKLSMDIIGLFPQNNFIFNDLSKKMLGKLKHRIDNLGATIHARYIAGAAEDILLEIKEPVYLLCMEAALHHFYDYEDILYKMVRLKPRYIFFALEPINSREVGMFTKIMHTCAYGKFFLRPVFTKLPYVHIIKKIVAIVSADTAKKSIENEKEQRMHRIAESGSEKISYNRIKFFFHDNKYCIVREDVGFAHYRHIPIYQYVMKPLRLFNHFTVLFERID